MTDRMPAVAAKVRLRLQIRRDLPPPEERRRLREASGLSQQEIAEIVGTTRQAVGHWEAGIRTPRGALLDRYVETIRALRGMAEEQPR